MVEEELKSDSTTKQKRKMSTKNLLKPWIPLEGLPKVMYIEALHDDYEGFRILLKGETSDSAMLRISFEDKLSYKNTDESYLLEIWHTAEKDILGRTFYMIDNSTYVDFFNEMTHGLYSDWRIKHYAIYTVSDCIDIISVKPPSVEWLN